VPPDTIRRVRERARGICEYCRLSSGFHPAPFQVDHIISKKHDGADGLDNLALACMHCNRHKGPNVAGIDAETGDMTRLFHPRLEDWSRHFRHRGEEIPGLTPIGRVTVRVLFMNDPEVLWLRSDLAAEAE
jgi:hypothetical protein